MLFRSIITEQISGSESRIAVLENDIARNEESAADLRAEIAALLVGQVLGALLQDDFTGVAHGIDRMAHTVDQTGAVARLLA